MRGILAESLHGSDGPDIGGGAPGKGSANGARRTFDVTTLADPSVVENLKEVR